VPAAAHTRRALAAVAVSLVITSACADDSPEQVTPLTTSSSTTSSTTTTTAPVPEGSQVAQAHGSSIEVYASADAEAPDRSIVSGEDTSHPDIPVVFLVKEPVRDLETDTGRVEVYLPVRPNGSTGWVDAADVDLTVVPYRIEVAITEHRLRVFDGDEVIVDEPVGVGTQDRPTPGGVYYLKELLQPPNPNSAYGVYAYGLSGFSNVLESFNGGPGVIGIHGTNDPSSIGKDVSSGCIRMHNEVITRMVEEIGLPLGTPVEILA
jgi:lipoprotein-anchoring transpeptidase ErfK/SrfK